MSTTSPVPTTLERPVLTLYDPQTGAPSLKELRISLRNKAGTSATPFLIKHFCQISWGIFFPCDHISDFIIQVNGKENSFYSQSCWKSSPLRSLLGRTRHGAEIHCHDGPVSFSWQARGIKKLCEHYLLFLSKVIKALGVQPRE